MSAEGWGRQVGVLSPKATKDTGVHMDTGVLQGHLALPGTLGSIRDTGVHQGLWVFQTHWGPLGTSGAEGHPDLLGTSVSTRTLY